MIASYGKRRTLTVIRMKSIVSQTIDVYKYNFGIPSNIIMAGKKSDEQSAASVASIDTIISRYKTGVLDYLLDSEFIVIDEAHMATGDSYRNVLEWLSGNGRKNKIFVGFSATPYNVGYRGHTFFDCYVKPISPSELRDDSFLVPIKAYVPEKVDLSNVKVTGGEYNQKQLAIECSRNDIVGDVVANYKKHGDSRPAILFAVNIKHSELLADAFNRAGIPAMHCDQSSSNEERILAKESLSDGIIKVLCNINIFATGVDFPFIEVCIMARPTLSLVLFDQQCGRALRPSPGKEFATFFDHAGNFDRHLSPYSHREIAMFDLPKGRKSQALPSTTRCPKCFYFMEGVKHVCEACGHQIVKKQAVPDHVEGELELLIDTKSQVDADQFNGRRIYFRHYLSRVGKFRTAGSKPYKNKDVKNAQIFAYNSTVKEDFRYIPGLVDVVPIEVRRLCQEHLKEEIESYKKLFGIVDFKVKPKSTNYFYKLYYKYIRIFGRTKALRMAYLHAVKKDATVIPLLEHKVPEEIRKSVERQLKLS